MATFCILGGGLRATFYILGGDLGLPCPILHKKTAHFSMDGKFVDFRYIFSAWHKAQTGLLHQTLQKLNLYAF